MGAKIVGVPYRGGGPIAQALAANEVQVTRVGLGNFIGLIQAGKVKALAVNSKQRSSLVRMYRPSRKPDWTAILDMAGGLTAPKGTPPDCRPVQSRIREAVSRSKFCVFLRPASCGVPSNNSK